MRKKSSTTLKNSGVSPLFCAVIAALLLAAALNVWLFVRSLYSATSRQGETPIATVTWKHKVAQRRLLDRLAWDRLGQESYLYDGDTIRTASLAEAEIRFIDGSVINMDENTMTQVFLVNGVSSAVLDGGNVTVDSSSTEKGMTLRQGNVTVQVDSGSSLSASASARDGDGQTGGLALKLITGSAAVADGEARSVLDTDSQLVLSDGATERIEDLLTVSSPSPSEKILSYSRDAVQVPFIWSQRDADMRVILELSRSRNFSSVLNRIPVTNLREISVPFDNGVTYWRFVSVDTSQNAESVPLPCASGHLRVFQSPPPELVSPVQNQSFSYRTKLPQLNLSWSVATDASYYLVEVADNPKINNPIIAQQTQLHSLRITVPSAGEWWWRVTPYYAINETGFANPSELRSFTVLQSGALVQPRLQRPIANSFVNSNLGDALFSWYVDSEAQSYTLRIANNSALNNPVVLIETNKNYASVRIANTRITDGNWWWGVTSTDEEGNPSPPSESRAFIVMNGELVFRPSFPPDGYTIDSAQLRGTRFAWETNIPYKTRIQISSDENFSSVVRDMSSQNSSIDSLSLSEGNYWWRIRADTDTMELDSPVRRFTVIGQMAAPICTAPAENSRVVPRPSQPYEFTWTSVKGASYYNVALYNSSSRAPVFEENNIRETALAINMDTMTEGNYRWTVQPFAEETALSSRRVGLLGSATFQMSRLRPIALESPADGARLDGVQAIVNPIRARWFSVEDARSSVLTLWRVEDESRSVVQEIRNPQSGVQLPRLQSGRYSWTVSATTSDGFNISAQGQNLFTVLPVPPLPAPTSLSSGDTAVFGQNYFSSSREIVFSWDAVQNATEYLLTIRKAGGAARQERGVSGTVFIVQPSDGPVLFSQTVNSTSYTFTEFDKLDRGDFVWSVRAQSYLEDGTLLYNGEEASSRFKLNVPPVSIPRINQTGTLYGD